MFIMLLKIEASHLQMEVFGNGAWHLSWWAATTVGAELWTAWGDIRWQKR